MVLTRTSQTAATLLIVLLLSVPGCGRTEKGEVAESTKIRLGWQVAWATQGQLALILQKTNALGLVNLDGDFKSFTYGAPLSEAALAGQLDAAFVGDQPAINLVSRSSDWRIVGRLMDFRVAIVVPPSSSARTLSDLRGKTLAIPFGASTHRVALAQLREAGVNPTTDLHIINVGIEEQGDLVRAGGGGAWHGVDAVASWDHHIAAYETKGLARIISSGKAIGVVVMSEKFLKSHPEAAASFLSALKLAYFFYAHHQEEADQWFSEITSGHIDPEILRTVASIEPNLKARDATDVQIRLTGEQVSALQSAADFALAQRLIATPVDVRLVTSNELADRSERVLAANPGFAARVARTR